MPAAFAYPGGQAAYRLLEHQTRAQGLEQLSGSRFKRVRLTLGNITDVLVGRKFPGKAFLLTFVDACGIALETDRRWEQAWDRLETDRYRRRAAGAEAEADQIDVEADQLRQRLTEAEEHIRNFNVREAAAKAQALHAEAEAKDLRRQLTKAEAQAIRAANQIRMCPHCGKVAAP